MTYQRLPKQTLGSILVGCQRGQDHRDEQIAQCLSEEPDAQLGRLREEIPLLARRFADRILLEHQERATHVIRNPKFVVQLGPNWNLNLGAFFFGTCIYAVLAESLAVRVKGFFLSAFALIVVIGSQVQL